MDPIQELIAHVGQGQVNGGFSTVPSVATTAAPRRTKLVFVYSDEDEDVVSYSDNTTAANGVAEVPCETHAIRFSEDTLGELRADAHSIDTHQHALSDNIGEEYDGVNDLMFHEDVLSGLGAAASATKLTAALMNDFASGASGRMRTREVDAPALWDGAFAASTADGRMDDDAAGTDEAAEAPALLRRGLPAATFVLESCRKRFRDTVGEFMNGVPSLTSSAPAAAVPQAASSAGVPVSSGADANADIKSEEEDEVGVETLDVLPVYEEDGMTVRALQTRGGYQLTLDERDLLENADDEEDVNDTAAYNAAAVEPHIDELDEAVAETVVPLDEVDETISDTLNEATAAVDEGATQEDWDDLFDDDDEDDEEEIDEAIVVAVVEQLVRCCEADDLDPQMRLEATRFTSAAKPLLKSLLEGTITPKEFGQKIDLDLRRFQRIYRSVYRPRDSPIVIDGVVMDM